jgi:cytochrome c-type biogenesis protein CcmF
MHMTAYLLLLLALLACLGGSGWALAASWRGEHKNLLWVEMGQLGVAGLVTISSIFLAAALWARDYSFQYVFEHVDNVLPLFYTLTAFWAGQEGSLLFWQWMVALMGALCLITPGYKSLAPSTRMLFWVFFLAVQAFFLLLLTCWSNPFMVLTPLQMNGKGLNPLLRNPGMIFHPPLLFLGYAGFTIPACVSLASVLTAEPRPWVAVTRNWTIAAWVFLTAGIILGGWWSYMELGWGGYWAWDPVENASLIPWLSATAFLHTALIENSRGALRRTNVVLMGLTFLLCIFGTYLVRSGVIQSLHAFGEGGVGLPLLWSMGAMGLIVVLSLLLGEKPVYRSLSHPMSRQGLLLLVAWLLLALGLVVIIGTMWPVISKLWSERPVGLDAAFYNRVTLPLFTLLALILVACPWVGWKEGVRDKLGLALTGAAFVAAGAVLVAKGVTLPLALISGAAGAAVAVGWVLVPLRIPGMRRTRPSLAAAGVHLGVALMILGVAVSGPYQVVREAVIDKNAPMDIDGYTVRLKDFTENTSLEMYAARAVLEVSREGKVLGELVPERRIYRGFDSPFAEVSTLPGLGDEIYATLLAFTDDRQVTVKISVNPLVNWIWIGGTISCLLGLFLFRNPSPARAVAREEAARP